MSNLEQIRKEISTTFPGKKFRLKLTEECKKGYDISCTDGRPNMTNHVIYNRVLVRVEGRDPEMVSMHDHREVVSFVDLKEYFDNLSEAGVPDTVLRRVGSLDYADREPALEKISNDSLIPMEDLKKRVDTLINAPVYNGGLDIV